MSTDSPVLVVLREGAGDHSHVLVSGTGSYDGVDGVGGCVTQSVPVGRTGAGTSGCVTCRTSGTLLLQFQ